MAEQIEFRTLADIPRFHAANRPEDLALHQEGRDTTWAQWDRLSNQVAHALRATGAGATGRIGYLGKNSDRFFHAFFGAVRAGVVTVPINWRLAASEIAFILEDAGCEILLLGADYLPLLPELRSRCPRLREVISIDGPAEGATALDDWLRGQPERDPGIGISGSDVALQLYTSGTTGLPKGAQLTHDNLLFAASRGGTEEFRHWRGDDVSVLPLPLFHAGGLVYGLAGPYAGCMTIVVREANPALIFAALRSAPRPATRLGVVPAVLQMMLAQPDLVDIDFSSLRTLTYGGSPIPPSVLRRAIETFGPVLVQLFGMTETAAMGTALLPQDHDPALSDRLSSCGRPLPGVEVRVVGPDGAKVAAGESGEILIRCAAVMKGYWNREPESRAALQDGWYHSGDVGCFDADGYLFIRDRLKDMILSGGENVYPAEVERVLAEHPAVAEAAVFGVPDTTWGEAVKAAVVKLEGHDVTQEQLIAFARERIAGYKCPKSIDFVDALPRNATGKLLKRVLREPYWAGHSRNVS
jgi:acyl-CoA synthetase (AMP-forming)/AMP-acid ligase II